MFIEKSAGKHRAARVLIIGFLAVLLQLVGISVPISAMERAQVWADANTGFAIGGYDPVSYFIEQKPTKGGQCCEGEWAGTFWRFKNEGNRAAFLDAPSVYAPRFGGHDPVSASRGFVVPGDPEIWAIEDGNLYLFHSFPSRKIWQLSEGSMEKEASDFWRSKQ